MNNKTDIIKDFEEIRKLCSSPHYKPIITANQYYMNKIQNPDYCNTHVMKNYFDEYCFDMNGFSDIVFTTKIHIDCSIQIFLNHLIHITLLFYRQYYQKSQI